MSYKKPEVKIDEGFAEGIYAASGCQAVVARIHQKPEVGRNDYRIQADVKHQADHTVEEEEFLIQFNQSVTFKEWNVGTATLIGSATGAELRFKINRHANPVENIGAGDLIVESGNGLAIIGTWMEKIHDI